jgi:AcrR family transcriptional regulator
MEEKESHDKILNGATELFRKYGVRSITMDDIAHHLGISKKTIYQYFADKDDIVTLGTRMHLTNERKMFERVSKEAKDAIEQMFSLTRCMNSNLKDSNASLIFDLQKYHARSWNLILEFKHGFLRELITDNLKAGIAQGYFRDDINVEVLSKIRLETVSLAHDDHIFPRDQYDLGELQMSLLDHFIHGIMTVKGKKIYKKYKEAYERADNPS